MCEVGKENMFTFADHMGKTLSYPDLDFTAFKIQEPKGEQFFPIISETSKSLYEKYPCNVIDENTFKESITDIFNMLADIVGKTLGPYGGITWIEEMGAYHPTKDGFTVLKNIRFNNRKNNTILNFINSISHQMVMKVGDGSTTAIIAAHEFLKFMMNLETSNILYKMRPKDISYYISSLADKLSEIIQRNSTPVTEDDFVKVMGKVAKIATNDNDEFTKFIEEIYEKSGPETYISKRLSMTDVSEYQIMDGMFYIAGRYCDKIYCNSDNGAKCRIENPLILCFNFTLGNEHWDVIKLGLKYMMETEPGRRMVIIAPNYDQYFMDHVRADIQDFIVAYQQQTSGGAIPFPMVFVKNPFFKSVERVIYDDLPPFLGTRMISPLDVEGLLKEITEYYKVVGFYNQTQNAIQETIKAREQMISTRIKQGLNPNDTEFMSTLPIAPRLPEDNGDSLRIMLQEKVGSWFGECGTISIGAETVEFYELNKKNVGVIEAHIMDAKDQYQRELNSIENYRYITKEYIEAQERLSRISCKSAIIRVGGNSDLEKKLNDDTLDDAIRACRSTIVYGYNLGNNYAIFKAINEYRKEIDSIKAEDKTNKMKVHLELMEILEKAFNQVIYRIHANKDKDVTLKAVTDITEKGLEKDMVWDVNTEKYTKDIINSSRTDIEILKAAISIIGTILSANQYLAVEIAEEK